MKEKIKEFIKTEKNLAEYKISLLEKSDKKYAKRIIAKEKNFIDFDFSDIKFSSIDECRKAIYLFKISKVDFLTKYKINKINSKVSSVLKNIEKYKILINNNLIDNFYFKSLSNKNLYKDNGELKKVIFKRILILKILLMHSYNFIKENNTLLINKILENVYYSFYFNNWLESYLDRFSKEESALLFSIFKNYINLFEDVNYKKLFLINKTKNTDLLITNLPHQGFEKVNVLYLELNKKNGESVSIKNKKFSNFPINGKYYKCIKINSGDINDVDNLDLNNSFLICNLSRREMEHNLENMLWLKFTLDKLINEENI